MNRETDEERDGGDLALLGAFRLHRFRLLFRHLPLSAAIN
jgi:hypothetical protein